MLTDAGKQRFTELVADTGPQNYTDDGFGVHLAFFNRTPAEARDAHPRGPPPPGRGAPARASAKPSRAPAIRSTATHKQLHQLGLESSEREVKWLNDLIAAETRGRPGRLGKPRNHSP